MTQSEYARQSGLTRQRVSQLVATGMPLDSKDAADQWRVRNVKGMIHRPPSTSPSPESPPQPATRLGSAQTPDGPYRPPEADQPVDRARVSDDTPQGAYERQRQIERAAYALAARALRDQSANARHLVAVHAQAARNLSLAKLEVLAVAERERNLVSGDWVKRMFTQHDGTLVTLVKAMPKQLSGRISPHDPEHAERELMRWVQEVFLKTMHNTNPFNDEQSQSQD